MTTHDPRLIGWLLAWPGLRRGAILPIILRHVERDLSRPIGGAEIVHAALAVGCRCLINRSGMVVIRRPRHPIPA